MLTKRLFGMLILFIGIMLVFSMVSCSLDGGDLRCSVQVNNKAAGKSIMTAESTVELHILQFSYHLGTQSEVAPEIIIIDNGYKGGDGGVVINNAGWYDASKKEWLSQTTPHNGAYLCLNFTIDKIRIDGAEYSNGLNSGTHWLTTEEGFIPFTFTDSTEILETILTVDPGILVSDGLDGQKLAADPYSFIRVKAKLNN